MRSLRLLLLLAIAHQVYGERNIFCPNNGIPKSDVKCLPGQSESNNVCGEGYSCYFSGLNYHCCPTGDEEEDKKAHGECPDYTIALLDSSGHPVRCSIGNQCPENMFCNDESPSPICCQNLRNENPQQKAILQAVEEFFNDEPKEAEKEPECPKNSLSILNEDGEATFCSTEADCPQSGMLCHGSGRKICCESVESVGSTSKKTEANSINIRPSSTESPKTTTAKPAPKSTTKSSIKSVTDLISNKSSTQNTKSAKIGLSEASYKKDTNKEASPKAHASKTAVFDENNKPIKYEPHAAGGYAVSQTINKLNEISKENKKEVVQQYLLQQIKRGWPYNDEFFRPRQERTVLLENPSTIVHFD